MKKVILILAGSFLLLTAPRYTEAATVTWTNTAGGYWSDATNWNPSVVPGSGDDVVITNAGSYIVTLQGSVSINSLMLGDVGSSPVLRIEGFSTSSAILTLANGFTNNATVELINANTNQNRNATLTVNGGPLVNSATGTLLVPGGAGGGSRYIYAELNNQGTLSADYPFTLYKIGAAHTNAGTFTTSADLTLNLSSSSFDNSGSMTFLGGALLDINGNSTSLSTFSTTGTLNLGTGNLELYYTTFNYGGTVSGSVTQDYYTVILNLASDLSNAATELLFYNTTVNGPGALINASGKSMLLNQTTCNADLVNEGELTCWRNSYVNGGFENTGSATIRVEGSSAGNANLILANSFTNNSLLEIINTYSNANRNAEITVNGGTLVNGAGGTLLVSEGAGGGSREISAELYNQGALIADYPFTIYKIGAAHTNAGSITTSGELTLTLNSSSFDNSGSMTFTDGALLDINGNSTSLSTFTTTGTLDLGTGSLEVYYTTFNYGGTVSGSVTQDYSTVILNLTPDLSNAATELLFYNSTVNGPGTLINASGKSMLLHLVTCNADLLNEGELVCWRNTYVNGGFDNIGSATIRVEGSSSGSANLILANSFTNNSVLELINTYSNANRNAEITVTSGHLVNSAAGTLLVSTGAGGGSREISAELYNLGTLNADYPFTLYKSGAAHTNAGSITTSGELTLTLNSSSFDNSGSMTFTDGALLDVNGNSTSLSTFTTTGTLDLGTGSLEVYYTTFNYGGAVSGSVTQDYSNAILNLTPDLSNAATELLFYNTTVNGPGTLINAAGKSMLLYFLTCNADLVNEGELTCWRNSYINGGFENTGSATIRVEGSSAGSANLFLANSFTNNSVIELINTYSNANRNAEITVTSGHLVNSASGTLLVSTGAGGGSREISAELLNQGILSADYPFTIYKNGAAHTNTGSIATSGELTLTLSNSSFDNSGSMTFSGGALLDINGNSSSISTFTTTGALSLGSGSLEVTHTTFNYGGTVSGSVTQDYSNVILNLTPDLSNAATEILLYNTDINGPGTLINASGKTMLLNLVTCNADLVNEGELICWRNDYINGGFESDGSATIRVEGSSAGNANLILANSFTNNAMLELTNTNANRSATLTMNGEVFVNSASGSLLASLGAGDGNRTIAAPLVNQGSLAVNYPLTIYKYNASHTNAGEIAVSGGDLTVTVSGLAVGFFNSGSIDIEASRTMSVSSGLFTNQVDGLIRGSGLLDIDGTDFDLASSGTVAPGLSAGQLDVTGDYNPSSNGVLEVEIGGVTVGSGYDRLAISGAAALDGTLDASLINGYEPVQYDSFSVATFASHTGTFAATNLPSPHLYGWEVEYTNTSVNLIVVNTAPKFDAITNQTVDELTELSLDASATDADTPVQTLTYSLLDEPAGASIDPGTGLFTWTPSEVQGPGTNTITVVVVDDGMPNLSATNEFEVVVNEVNEAPFFIEPPTNRVMDELTLLTVTNAAGDADIPTNTLTYSLLSPPVGAVINPTNGVITWTPAEDQGPGTNTITTVVTDDGIPSLSTTNEFEVIINEVNLVPVFNATPDDVIMAELTLLTVSNAASDADLPANTLTYSLLAPPAGALINPTNGVITWTPGEDQGPDIVTIISVVTDDGVPALSATNAFDVMVNEVNAPPFFIGTPTNVTMDELTSLTVTNEAGDVDLPANALTYSLLSPPAGALINPTNGVITWTPGEEQGPGTNTITTVVTDSGVPALSVTNAFEVVVNEVNEAPAFDATPNSVSVDELTLLTVTNTAGDADLPAGTLTYSLLSPPAGALINPTNGVITWTPGEDQGPGTNTITTVVTDDGVPVLSSTNSFEVVVGEVNAAPVLDSVSDATIHAETLFSATLTATDSDLPTNALSYSLVSGPAGALVDSGSGLFTWTPDSGDVGGPGAVTVKVEDSGSPVLSDTNTFYLTVVDPLAFIAIDTSPTGSVSVTWNAISGQTYRVWYTDDLISGTWSNLVPDVVAEGPSATWVDAAASNEVIRFYDVNKLE